MPTKPNQTGTRSTYYALVCISWYDPFTRTYSTMPYVQGDACCWVCTSCKARQRVVDGRECVDCGDGWWPTTDKQTCYRLPQRYMSWSSLYTIIPGLMAAMGIILTVSVITTFVRNVNTPVVRAAGRELCFLCLAGLLICFSMPFALLAKPSVWSCATWRLGVGIGFALTYSSLLTKTNRIARIFDSARRSARRPAFISPRSQLFATAMLVVLRSVDRTPVTQCAP